MRYVITPTLNGDLLYDWLLVSERYDDPYVDPRMVAAVQETVAEGRRFHNVIVYDADDIPVAVACFFAERADFLLMAPPGVRRFAARVRRVRKMFFRFPMLFCGMPASAGWNQLRVRPGADIAQVAKTLDRARAELRRRAWGWASVCMEFADEEISQWQPLAGLGYVRADSQPMYVLPAAGRTFAEYLGAMKSHYRSRITPSRRKFAATGIRIEHHTGRKDLADLFTDELYDLYRQVLRHAETVMHVLPIEYFRAVAASFGEQFSLSIAYDGARPVGFGSGIFAGSSYYWSFVGFDYQTNARTDLYFNLFYHTLEHVMQRRVQRVYLGSDSDRFKQRLGCHREQRHVLIKVDGLFGRIFERTSSFWMPPQPEVELEMDAFAKRPAADSHHRVAHHD